MKTKTNLMRQKKIVLNFIAFTAGEENGELTKQWQARDFEMASTYGTFIVSWSCISIHYHLVATCLARVWGVSTWADILAPAQAGGEKLLWGA